MILAYKIIDLNYTTLYNNYVKYELNVIINKTIKYK